jgi:hypothetical protein
LNTTPSLPALPNLEQLKHQAKDLVKQFKAHSPEALRRVQAHLPRAANLPTESLSTTKLTLSEAQFVLAREYEFPSWPRLKRHIETSQPDQDATLEAFKRVVQEGDSQKLRTLLRTYPTLKAQIDAPLFSFDSPAVLSAASRNDRKIMEVLLEHGADINGRSRWWAGGFGILPNRDGSYEFMMTGENRLLFGQVQAGVGLHRLNVRENARLFLGQKQICIAMAGVNLSSSCLSWFKNQTYPFDFEGIMSVRV